MEEEDLVNAALGINMLLGLWTIFSPFLLGFGHVPPAVWNGLGMGLLVAFFSGIRVSIGYRQTAWSWCTALLSVWLIVSPFVLGFMKASAVAWNDIIVGVVMLLLSWKAASTPGLRTVCDPGTSPDRVKSHSAVS